LEKDDVPAVLEVCSTQVVEVMSSILSYCDETRHVSVDSLSEAGVPTPPGPEALVCAATGLATLVLAMYTPPASDRLL